MKKSRDKDLELYIAGKITASEYVFPIIKDRREIENIKVVYTSKGKVDLMNRFIPPLDEQRHTRGDVWRTIPDGILYQEFSRYWL